LFLFVKNEILTEKMANFGKFWLKRLIEVWITLKRAFLKKEVLKRVVEGWITLH